MEAIEKKIDKTVDAEVLKLSLPKVNIPELPKVSIPELPKPAVSSPPKAEEKAQIVQTATHPSKKEEKKKMDNYVFTKAAPKEFIVKDKPSVTELDKQQQEERIACERRDAEIQRAADAATAAFKGTTAPVTPKAKTMTTVKATVILKENTIPVAVPLVKGQQVANLRSVLKSVQGEMAEKEREVCRAVEERGEAEKLMEVMGYVLSFLCVLSINQTHAHFRIFHIH